MNSIKSPNAKYLMQVFAQIIRPPYKEWKVGISAIPNPDTEDSAALFVTVFDDTATQQAFLNFVCLGVTPLQMIGRHARYLYAYKVGLKDIMDIP